MQFGQHTDVVHHLRRLAPATLIKIAGVAAVMSRAADMAVACEAMNRFRLVTDVHQIGDEGLHLRCHRPRYRDVDSGSSRHRHKAKTRVAVGVERTCLWQDRSRYALMTPHWRTLNYSWRCGQISRTDAVTAKLSDGPDCRLWVRPCIGWSREHAPEHERDSASVLSFHVTCLLVVCSSESAVIEACGSTSPCESATASVWMPVAGKG